MKLVLAALIVVGLVVGRRLYVQWQARQPPEGRGRHSVLAAARFRRVPSELLAGAERTWVVFTTPGVADADAVHRQLDLHDPGARVVTVDARREPHLAEALEVRSYPTAVLADRHGDVQAHLVGAAAVRDYLVARPSTA